MYHEGGSTVPRERIRAVWCRSENLQSGDMYSLFCLGVFAQLEVIFAPRMTGEECFSSAFVLDRRLF